MTVPAVPEPANLFPLPTTGEAVDLEQPADVARALQVLRDFKSNELADAIKVLEAALEPEFERVGSKTLHFANLEAKLVEKNETTWDTEYLRASLERAGCPEERINELIQEEITYKVNGNVARQLSTNPKYERRIKRAKTVTPGYRYVSVK